MYAPPHFRHEDPVAIRRFIEANGFGILVDTVDGRPWATHLPLVLRTDLGECADVGTDADTGTGWALEGHVARANAAHTSFRENGFSASGTPALAIFPGPHAYVSSGWYAHENVPTWNYTAVHCHGTLEVLAGEALLLSLKRLTDKYEAGRPEPGRVEALSARTMRQVSGIVGFRLHVTEVHAVRKLSQNRDDADHAAIVARLDDTGDPSARALAAEMRAERGEPPPAT